MRFASIRDFRLNASAILKKAGAEESVVVTRRGKPVAVLVPTNEELLDGMLRAVNVARFQAGVEGLRRQARRAGTDKLTMREIEAEIKKVRAARRA